MTAFLRKSKVALLKHMKSIPDAPAANDAHGKREWVEWAGKTLMPRLHAQIAMERADEMRAEQEALEEMRRQDERVQ
jgi:hypothetical protein